MAPLARGRFAPPAGEVVIIMGSVYDLIVVGGGIAGLATAEIFARSGRKVALLEKNEKLATETSGAHHEWFHFGSLYSIFPTRRYLRTLVGGIDDVLAYYSGFRGMNLRVDGDGKLMTVPAEAEWLRDETIEYIVAARNDEDFALRQASGVRALGYSLGARLSWDLLIKRFICRHTRFHKYDWRRGCASQYIPRASWYDYSRHYISKFSDPDIRLNPDTHFRIPSYDRPMNASNIVADLTRGLLAAGGEVFMKAHYDGFTSRDGVVRVRLQDGRTLEAKQVVLALGANLQQCAKNGVKVKSVAAPLLVVYPHVCERNVVRLTPFVEQTINHLKHYVDGQAYSLIGGGYFANPADLEQRATVGRQLEERAAAVFPRMRDASVRQVYFSLKTELAASVNTRNYLYRIEQLDPSVFVIVPGKFSLCFSLAVNTFQRLTGEAPKPSVRYDADRDVSSLLDIMLHKQIVRSGRNGFRVETPHDVAAAAATPTSATAGGGLF